MLELRNITKTYYVGQQSIPVLHGVDLDIEQGSYTAIMGPSGSGKSTLMNIVGLLDSPTSGTYNIRGQEVSDISESKRSLIRRQQIGFVFQNYSLIPRLSIIEQVSLPLLYQGVSSHKARERARQALMDVSIVGKENNMPNELSGGQKQRVSIARALVINPSIILADEPTGALDSVTSDEIMDLFDSLHASGKTILLITHEKAVADRAEHIIYVSDGVVV